MTRTFGYARIHDGTFPGLNKEGLPNGWANKGIVMFWAFAGSQPRASGKDNFDVHLVCRDMGGSPYGRSGPISDSGRRKGPLSDHRDFR